MSLLVALLLTTTVLVGWTVDTGQPVYRTMMTMDEVKASPEWATLMRNRNAHRLVELRAAERDQVPGVGEAPTPPAEQSVPGNAAGDAGENPAAGGLIQWRPEVERWRPLVARYFQAEDVEHALAIIRCESVGDPDAVNPASGTAGLFQHRPQYWPARSTAAGWAGWPILDPEANTAVAAWLVYAGGGWAHWSGRAWGVESCEEYACTQGVC